MADDEIMMEDAGFSPTEDDGLTIDDFNKGNFVKNPQVGQTLTFKVLRIVENKETKGKNQKTGKEFDVGLKNKSGQVKRYDIETDQGIYTINNWEIFFKLIGDGKNGRIKGELTKYADAHNKKFNGAVISITRLMDGAHANYKVEDLAKIIGKSIADATAYQEEIKKAIREQRLFTVKLEE
jgi:hypothetical protein